LHLEFKADRRPFQISSRHLLSYPDIEPASQAENSGHINYSVLKIDRCIHLEFFAERIDLRSGKSLPLSHAFSACLQQLEVPNFSFFTISDAQMRYSSHCFAIQLSLRWLSVSETVEIKCSHPAAFLANILRDREPRTESKPSNHALAFRGW
jgi:hypothetical protein